QPESYVGCRLDIHAIALSLLRPRKLLPQRIYDEFRSAPRRSRARAGRGLPADSRFAERVWRYPAGAVVLACAHSRVAAVPGVAHFAPSGAPLAHTSETRISSSAQCTLSVPVTTRNEDDGPGSPLGPGGPAAPGGPAGPCGPASPRWPAGPAGPCPPASPSG